ncbi:MULTISPECIES: endonuclease [unclassified Streptomyces]|uniref:endonuclease n=1 Tax=unclassified Streptomyces TaxID=2593676 RepID=UPI002E2836E1|nr:endonuclease [Streptomyces sp. NBC_00223]
MAPTQREVLRTLLDDYGRTYAHEAGIRLTDTPQPLYRLLVLSCLLSARIRAGVAVAAAKELSAAGMRDPKRMAEATWQQRVDALGRGGYRRYDERTATQLGDGARLVTERYGGDLRRLREQAGGDVAEIRRLLREFPGLGPAGADIFLREVQNVWPEAAPYIDAKALQGAERLGLPASPPRLMRPAPDADPATLAAALVRVALNKDAAPRVRAHAAAH